MANRTYRYFNGKPLYPFGHGRDLSLPTNAVAAGQPVEADITVTNTGKVVGDEVVQVYLRFPVTKGAPQIALRGFQRIHLDSGASRRLHFELKDRDLGMVTEDGNPIIAKGNYTISIGGGQPDTGAPTVNGKFHIDDQVDLPEWRSQRIKLGDHDSTIGKENAVNKLRNTVVLTILAAGLALTAWAADLTGQWTATFNTQIGEQHYTYTFKVDGEKLTGTAKNDRGTTEITNGTIKGDKISFDESLDFNGQTIPITYTGTVSGDLIKLHRKVGDFAEEDLVANRVK